MYFLLVLCFCTLSPVSGQELSDYKQLYTDLFTNHNKYVIPKIDKKTALTLQATFNIISLSNFDEIGENIVLTACLHIQWNDIGMTWNPSSYEGADTITASSTNVWVPPVMLFNSAEQLKPVGADNVSPVTVAHDGNMTYAACDILKARCKADIYKFPYDTQQCTLNFVIRGLRGKDCIFGESNSSTNTIYYTPNSNWKLVTIKANTHLFVGYSYFDVDIHIQREPLYFAVQILGPCILFSILNPLVFLLPVESGERVGLSMTILLSYILFLTLVASSIPASSNPLPLLVVVLVATATISSCIVVMTILNSALYYRDERRKVGALWIFLVYHLPCSWRNHFKPGDVIPKTGRTFNDVQAITWKDVSGTLDLFCMAFSYIILFIMFTVFMSIIIR